MAKFKNANCQAASFSFNTLGWILAMTCMGLAEWRVWHMESSTPSRGLACIGMWRVCTYQHTRPQGRVMACHRYSYSDTYLPLDIRISQNLLLAACLLGLLGKVLTVTGLLRVYAGRLQKDTPYNRFVASGVLSIIAGAFILTAVIWNRHSVLHEEGIRFPPSFHIPFRPDRQEMGSTVPVAVLAAFLMLLSGLLTISFQLPRDIHVYPEVPQV